MMIFTSPMSAASSSQITQFNGLISPEAWGAPFQLPGSPPPGPGPFPPPLLVVLLPSDGRLMPTHGSVQQGVLVVLLVLMTDTVNHIPRWSCVGNLTVQKAAAAGALT